MKLARVLLKITFMRFFLALFFIIQPFNANAIEKNVTIQAKPDSLEIDLKKTALIVVDMQNAYASKGGLFDRLGQDISGASGVIDNNFKIISAARSAGVKIIYLKMKILPELTGNDANDSPSLHKGIGFISKANKPRYKGKFMAQDPWNEEIVEQLKPVSSDIIIEKKSYSGFVGTNLDQMLKTLNIKYLIITGVATNSCVESTIRDAYALDYWPILISDGSNNVGPAITQQATIWNVEAFFGWVSTTNDLLKILSPK